MSLHGVRLVPLHGASGVFGVPGVSSTFLFQYLYCGECMVSYSDMDEIHTVDLIR